MDTRFNLYQIFLCYLPRLLCCEQRTVANGNSHLFTYAIELGLAVVSLFAMGSDSDVKANEFGVSNV